MNAVIYARFSSHNQQEQSIEGQIRYCTEYAKKNDMTIINSYIDRAISGTSDNRPEFLQMIKDSNNHQFNVVLVWKLDRFARNRYDSAIYKNALNCISILLIFSLIVWRTLSLVVFISEFVRLSSCWWFCTSWVWYGW